MKKLFVSVLITILAFASVAIAKPFNLAGGGSVQIGMTESEVLGIIGHEPDATQISPDSRILVWADQRSNLFTNVRKGFAVKFKDGRVVDMRTRY